jgi:hypothetical protein
MKRNTRNSAKSTRKNVERNRLNQGLFLVPNVDSNPRRKGSHGFKSLQVILNSRKPITVADATKKGARLRDIHWDITYGHLKLQKKAS